MLNATQNQPITALLLILFGFLGGLLFDISSLISYLSLNNKIVKNIFDFIATTLLFFIYFVLIMNFNYGLHRLWTISSFFIFAYLERISLAKILAKTFPWVYDKYIKFLKKLNKIFTKGKKNAKSQKG